MNTFTEKTIWTVGNRPPRTGGYLAFGVHPGRRCGTVYHGFYDEKNNEWTLPDEDCGSRECSLEFIHAWAEHPGGPQIDWQSGKIITDEDIEKQKEEDEW